MSFLQLHLAPLLRVCLLLRACRMHNKSISRFCCYPAERSCERNFVSSGPRAVRKDVLSAAATATQLSLSSIYIRQTDGQVHTNSRATLRAAARSALFSSVKLDALLLSQQTTHVHGIQRRCQQVSDDRALLIGGKLRRVFRHTTPNG